MPEGPEIRRVADRLWVHVGGRVVDLVCFGLEPLKRWEPRLQGAKIAAVNAHGKALVTQFDNGLCIYSHNQLYGRWEFCPRDQYPQTSRQLRLALHCQDHSALLYSASEIEVLEVEALPRHPFIAKLGPDVLDESTTAAQVLQRMESPAFARRQLGSILTDQRFLAGLGNYLRCEALFVAGIHPRLRAVDVAAHQRLALAEAVLGLSRQSYETGGITNDLSQAQGLMQQGASFEQARFHVFRRAGLPCYRCGATVEKVSHVGQACYVCPSCQSRSAFP